MTCREFDTRCYMTIPGFKMGRVTAEMRAHMAHCADCTEKLKALKREVKIWRNGGRMRPLARQGLMP